MRPPLAEFMTAHGTELPRGWSGDLFTSERSRYFPVSEPIGVVDNHGVSVGCASPVIQCAPLALCVDMHLRVWQFASRYNEPILTRKTTANAPHRVFGHLQKRLAFGTSPTSAISFCCHGCSLGSLALNAYSARRVTSSISSAIEHTAGWSD